MSEKITAELLTIEELQCKLHTAPCMFAAVKVQQGWGTGKQISEREYTAAVAAFCKGPMRGGK